MSSTNFTSSFPVQQIRDLLALTQDKKKKISALPKAEWIKVQRDIAYAKGCLLTGVGANLPDDLSDIRVPSDIPQAVQDLLDEKEALIRSHPTRACSGEEALWCLAFLQECEEQASQWEPAPKKAEEEEPQEPTPE